MGRIRRDFERIEDVKSSRLIVIAAEGQKDKSENRYFKAFISSKNLSNVQVRLLERDDRNSSPKMSRNNWMISKPNMNWGRMMNFGL